MGVCVTTISRSCMLGVTMTASLCSDFVLYPLSFARYSQYHPPKRLSPIVMTVTYNVKNVINSYL
jgi:hypothetical protein